MVLLQHLNGLTVYHAPAFFNIGDIDIWWKFVLPGGVGLLPEAEDASSDMLEAVRNFLEAP